MGVLGLPVAPGHAQGIHDGAIGNHVAPGTQFRDQDQFFLLVVAIGRKAVLEGRPDTLLIIRAAEPNKLIQRGVVGFYVGVGGHGGGIIA